MNNKKRTRLKQALNLCTQATDIVEAVYDEEQDAMDNTPENLQNSDRYEYLEETTDNLNDTIEKLNEVKDSIRDLINR